MKIRGNASLIAGLALLAGLTARAPTAAAQAEPNLAGKTVRMIIGVGPGGGYDLWGRTVAQHIGAYLPGHPTVISENMPGAGGLTSASYLYNIAPKDGTAIGIVTSGTPLAPLLGQTGAQFDSQKLSWLGTPTTDINVCIASKSAKVKTHQDLLHEELIVGDTGPGTDTQLYPLALNALIGTKFKRVSGFPSTSDVFLAMERGEVDGVCESLQSVSQKRPTWISNGDVNILFQGGAEVDPTIKAPYILDLAQTEEQKEAIKFLYAEQGIGRPFVAPPNLPPAMLQALRSAFDATMRDPAFIADAAKAKVTVAPRDGAYLSGIIDSIYATPKPVLAQIKKVIDQ